VRAEGRGGVDVRYVDDGTVGIVLEMTGEVFDHDPLGEPDIGLVMAGAVLDGELSRELAREPVSDVPRDRG
jgi:hypothetical protein